MLAEGGQPPLPHQRVGGLLPPLHTQVCLKIVWMYDTFGGEPVSPHVPTLRHDDGPKSWPNSQ